MDFPGRHNFRIHYTTSTYCVPSTNFVLLFRPAEYLPFHMSEVKASVPAHEIDYRVQLLIEKASVIGYHSNPDDRGHLNVLKIDLGYGYIEAALETADQTFDDAPLFLE